MPVIGIGLRMSNSQDYIFDLPSIRFGRRIGRINSESFATGSARGKKFQDENDKKDEKRLIVLL